MHAVHMQPVLVIGLEHSFSCYIFSMAKQAGDPCMSMVALGGYITHVTEYGR